MQSAVFRSLSQLFLQFMHECERGRGKYFTYAGYSLLFREEYSLHHSNAARCKKLNYFFSRAVESCQNHECTAFNPSLTALPKITRVTFVSSDLLTCFEQRYISALESRKNRKWFCNFVLRHGEINDEQSEYVNQ